MSELAAVSLLVSLLYSEFTGLTPGGIIVPFYFVLYFSDPVKMGLTLLSSALCMGCVKFASRYTILYGRRRFAIYLIFGLLIKIALSYLQFGGTYMQGQLSVTIGYLVPGILGNTMEKQGIWKTVFSLAFCVLLIHLLQVLLT